MYVTPSGKMGSCSWGMADLARHERQNTAYPPQTAHSQNPSDSAKCRPPNRLSFLCKILIRQLICPPWALQPRPKTSGALLVAENSATRALPSPNGAQPSTKSERAETDCAAPMGRGATATMERLAASLGQLAEATPRF